MSRAASVSSILTVAVSFDKDLGIKWLNYYSIEPIPTNYIIICLNLLSLIFLSFSVPISIFISFYSRQELVDYLLRNVSTLMFRGGGLNIRVQTFYSSFLLRALRSLSLLFLCLLSSLSVFLSFLISISFLSNCYLSVLECLKYMPESVVRPIVARPVFTTVGLTTYLKIMLSSGKNSKSKCLWYLPFPTIWGKRGVFSDN